MMEPRREDAANQHIMDAGNTRPCAFQRLKMARDSNNRSNDSRDNKENILEDWQSTLKDLGKEAKVEAEKEAERRRRELMADRKKNSRAAFAPTKEEVHESFAHIKGEITSFADIMTDVVPLKNAEQTRETKRAEPENIRLRKDIIEEENRNNPNRLFIGTDIPEDEEPPRRYCKTPSLRPQVGDLLKGKWEITEVLDLHGYNLDDAQVVLNEYIEHLVEKKDVVGEIVHGAGLNSQGFTSKMKILVRRWLIRHEGVLAYAEPAGNDGAIHILLKSYRREDEGRGRGGKGGRGRPGGPRGEGRNDRGPRGEGDNAERRGPRRNAAGKPGNESDAPKAEAPKSEAKEEKKD